MTRGLSQEPPPPRGWQGVKHLLSHSTAAGRPRGLQSSFVPCAVTHNMKFGPTKAKYGSKPAMSPSGQACVLYVFTQPQTVAPKVKSLLHFFPSAIFLPQKEAAAWLTSSNWTGLISFSTKVRTASRRRSNMTPSTSTNKPHAWAASLRCELCQQKEHHPRYL